MTSYRHIVFFKIHDGKLGSVEEAMLRLNGLGSLPGIKEWHVNKSIDERKGVIIVEDATFESAEAFEAFRTSAQHQEVADFMKQISDWWVGDYLTD